MSYSINKVKESIGLLSPSDLHSSVAIKQFGGAFSMGTSQRSVFSNNKMVPGPGSYDVITSKSALPTCKFAKSERNTFLGNHNPSPMEYKISEPLGKGSPTYSFGIRSTIKNENDINLIGPGSYDPQMLPSKYYSSFSFGYKSSSKIETLTPGPGTYHPFKEEEKKYENPKNETVLPKIQSENLAQTKISSENSQKLKKLFTNKTKQSNGFSISKREDLYNKENKKTPGPGAYQINYRASFNDAPGYKFINGPKGTITTPNTISEPGPGYFSVNEKQIYSSSPHFTISGKYKNIMDENLSARDNPGPGAYNPKMAIKEFDQRFKKSTKKINYSNENPGPGYYDIDSVNKLSHVTSFATGKRLKLYKDTEEPGPGHYIINSVNQGPKVPILGRHEIIQSLDKITPGPGNYFVEDGIPYKIKGSLMSKTKKNNSSIKDLRNPGPGPGQYNVNTSLEDSGPKYTFGGSFKKRSWKRHYEPGPGSYDIPSTIAGIPNYLLNYTPPMKSIENSKYSEYIKEINETINQKEEGNY